MPAIDAPAPRRKKKREEDFSGIGKAVARVTSAALHDVSSRLGSFSREFVTEQPHVAAHITFHTPDTDHAQRLARGLSDTWGWAKVAHSFAGVPGALMQPLLHWIRHPDPEASQRGQSTIRALQTLTPAEQQTLDESARASYMGVPEGTTAPVTGFEGQQLGLSETEAQRVRAKVAKEMGTSVQEVDSHLWDDYYAPALGIPGTSLAEVEKHPLGSALLSGGSLALLAAPGVSSLGVAGKALAAGRGFVGFSVAQPPVSAALRHAGGALEHVPGGHLIREAIAKPLGAASFLGRELMMPGAFAARKALDAAGVSPSDPLYSTVESFGGFLGGWMLGNVGARSVAGIKLARGAPEELVRGAGGPEAEAALRRHLGGPISGRVAKAFYDVFSKPVERWMRTGPGKRLADSIIKTTDPKKMQARLRSDIAATQDLLDTANTELAKVPLRRELSGLHGQLKLLNKDPAGLLVQRFENMPPEFAQAVAGAKTRAEVSLAFEEYINRLDGPGREAARVRIREIDTELGSAPGERVPSLRAEKATLQRRLAFANAEPLFEVPKSSLLRRLRTATPTSKLGQKLYVLYDPKVKFGVTPRPKVAHLFDDMGRNVFYNPRGPNAPADALSRNAEVVIRVGRRLGIPETRIRGFVERIAKGFSDQEIFQTFLRDFGRAIRDSDSVAADIKDRIAQRFEREVYERKKGIIAHKTDRGVVEENVLERNGSPQPTLSSQFINHIPLPDLDEMIEATSWIRSKIRPLEEARREAKDAGRRVPLSTTAVLPYQALKSLSSFATAVFKPLVLVTRWPALLLRIEGEEALRARMLGYPAHVFGRGGFHPLRGPLMPGELPESVAPMLGSYYQDAFETIPTTPVWRSVDTVEWRPDGRQPPPEAWDGIYEQLAHWRTSPEGVELAKRGVDGFLRWTEETESGKFWARQHQSILDESGTTWRDWATRNLRWLDQITSGNRALREAVVSGEWRLADAADIQARRRNVLGEDGAQEFARLNQEDLLHDDLIREALAEGDAETVRAFQDEQKHIRDRIKALDREGGLRTRRTVNFEETDKFKAEMNAAWQRGDYEFPPRIVVYERQPMADRIVEAGLVRRKVQETLYRPLRSVGRSDVKRVRGGTWKTIYEKEDARLRSLGHDADYAHRHAEVYAARQTADIMYDLSARSSAHQFTRNIFWFAPAWQEVLTTWAVKIPSRFYWPVGVAHLAGKTGLMLNLAKDLGLVHRDENGNLRTIIPGGEAFFDKFLPFLGGADTKVTELLSFDPGRLNLALGGWPGLSTQYNVALGAAAKKWGGVFGDLSNAFQFLGPEATVAPTPVNDLYEALTGKAPPWEVFSHDYQERLSDLAYDSALQDAFVQVGPPPSLPKEKLKGQTEAQRRKLESDYQAKWKDWAQEMFSTADHIQRGHELVTFLGHTIFPAPLRTSTKEREAWNRFFTKQVLAQPIGAGGFSQDQTNLINSYVSRHPDSLSYRVFRTVLGEQFRDLPFAPKQEDALWAQVFTGQRKVLTRDDYLQKVAAYSSYRLISGIREQALAEAAGVSVNTYENATGDQAKRIANALLINGFQKKDALHTANHDWKFYLDQHHEYDAQVEEGRQALARVYAKEGQPVALQSFEADRLSELNDAVWEVSRSLLLDGHLRSEWRQVASQAGELFSESFIAGEPKTAVGKALATFYDKRMTPYWDEVGPIYDKARRAGEAGLTDVQSAAYDKIRQINNRYTKLAGPSPEAVMYGNLSEADKETARLKWASQPSTWLSDFQLKTVGYAKHKHWDAFVNFANGYDEKVRAIVLRDKLSPASKDYQNLQAERDREIGAFAAKLGVSKQWELNEAAPYVRVLRFSKGAQSSLRFKQAADGAAYVQHVIDTAPEGSKTQTKIDNYNWFFGIVEDLTDRNSTNYAPKFAGVLKDLSYALAPAGKVHRSGRLLYSALWFGEFNPDFIPDAVLSQGRL